MARDSWLASTYDAWRSAVEPGGGIADPQPDRLVVDVDPDADPPKLLVIGPDRAGNLLEVVVLTLADDRLLAIHAMPLRRIYLDLLPESGGADG